ncbi:MAG TPA: LysM peptidoglycan-binding domain-containing protein [Candidatus Limiplasma pullistercoris]|nr:LysM peptidoglycan-binding domain-containing protein [Candidatus Limiplasma pullistercoris]
MAEQNGTNTGKCAEEYVVKRGDSFYLIAHKLGVPLRDLLAANRDIHPARLMVGDVLCVPREEDDSPQTGGLGSSTNGGVSSTTQSGGTTQTTQATGTAQSSGTTSGTQTTQATGMAGTAQTTQATGTAQGSGTTSGTQTTQATGMAGTTQTTQATGMAQGTGTTSGAQTTQATGTTSGAQTAQATGMTSATQPTCMTGSTGQTAPDTTLSCTEDEQWIVQKGQTVSDLQLRGLVSRHTLETANPGVDLENLSVGQTVCIPKDNVPCALPETYTLAATETLEAVAMRFNLPVASLLRANPCLAPQDFEGGVTVILPK